MSTLPSYSAALERLVKFQAAALLSSGEDLQARIESLIRSRLSNHSQDFILSILDEHLTIKRYAHDQRPKEYGMYLKLLHGRENADEEMDDWGADGPWIGPLKWFHCTYLSDIGIGFAGGEELTAMSNSIDAPFPMYLCQGMIYYDGMYYGDWELQNL